jgi:hypothetical protein
VQILGRSGDPVSVTATYQSSRTPERAAPAPPEITIADAVASADQL